MLVGEIQFIVAGGQVNKGEQTLLDSHWSARAVPSEGKRLARCRLDHIQYAKQYIEAETATQGERQRQQAVVAGKA